VSNTEPQRTRRKAGSQALITAIPPTAARRETQSESRCDGNYKEKATVKIRVLFEEHIVEPQCPHRMAKRKRAT
jgi:hypothetical protein